MTDTATNAFFLQAAVKTATDVPVPKPELFTTPVLIGDCVTPLAGETILSLLWKRLDADQ